MGLEDISNLPVSRRNFLSLTAGTIATYALDLPLFGQDAKKSAKQSDEGPPYLKKSRISFDLIKEALKKDPKGDAAGKYEQIKIQYLDQVLVEEYKIVHDKRKNKDGFVAAWFYWPNEQHKKKAEERIKADLIADAEGQKLNDYIAILDSYLPSRKIYTWSRGAPVGTVKDIFFLADKSIFELESEQDFFSTLDYECAIAHARRHNIKIGDKPLDVKNVTTHFFADHIINLYARNYQKVNIISGKRKVTAGFKAQMESAYSDARSKYEGRLQSLSEADTDFEKETHSVMSAYLKQADAELQRATELGKSAPPRR
jgi:hypothetical protein